MTISSTSDKPAGLCVKCRASKSSAHKRNWHNASKSSAHKLTTRARAQLTNENAKTSSTQTRTQPWHGRERLDFECSFNLDHEKSRFFSTIGATIDHPKRHPRILPKFSCRQVSYAAHFKNSKLTMEHIIYIFHNKISRGRAHVDCLYVGERERESARESETRRRARERAREGARGSERKRESKRVKERE